MISFVNYLLESGISLSLFALVYFLFLRRETFFNANRWFLLVSVGFSAILPLLYIPVYLSQATVLPEVTVTPYINLLSSVTVFGAALTSGVEQIVLNYSVLGYVYLMGVVVFGGIFFLRIYQIIRLITQNRVVPEGKIKLVVLDRELSPFSFLNYVFVSNNLQNTNGWEKMLEHERQHIQQGHSIDVLILEFIAVVQWFNPFFWMFRRALRENHEFLADQAVLALGTAPSWYKQILINQYVGDQIIIANNFNYSLIKTRIKMMSKIKSRKIASAKILIGMLLAVCLVVVFACDQKNLVSSRERVYEQVDQMPEYPGGQSELMKFISSSVRYPKLAMENGIQGKVFVGFVVGRDGSVKDVQIKRGADKLLDAEALRVISSFPKWTPGKEKGKKVAVQYTIPINFALN
jgi:TonB family protein